ncbi:hypothetical protein ACO2Q7_13955 [Rathayibacter sp. KR2-224]
MLRSTRAAHSIAGRAPDGVGSAEHAASGTYAGEGMVPWASGK